MAVVECTVSAAAMSEEKMGLAADFHAAVPVKLVLGHPFKT